MTTLLEIVNRLWEMESDEKFKTVFALHTGAEENIIPKLAERTTGVSPIPKSYEEEHAKDPLEDEFDPSKIPF